MRKKLLAIGAIGLMVVVAVALTGTWWTAFGQEEEQKLPEIPGITVKDTKSNGCVDCHRKVSKDKDYRLTSFISELAEKGEHPNVATTISTIPTDCMMCHSESAAKSIGTEPFATLLHKIHLVGGKENHFITNYQGKCTYCHALNKETGKWKIKTGKAHT